MTDSEKFDVILFKLGKLDSIELDMQEVKANIEGLKDDMNGVKTDISGLKTDMVNVKTDIDGLKTVTQALRQTVANLESNMANVKVELELLHRENIFILDEVERVHEILNRHKNDRSVHTA